MLHYHLLTDSQLDDLAHFYHQRTPGWYSLGYPMPVVGRWWAPGPRELEEGEIDEMEEVRKILDSTSSTDDGSWVPSFREMDEREIDEMNGVRKTLDSTDKARSEKEASTEEKRRRFGRFLGLRNCESSVGEGDMRRQMEEWVANEVTRRIHRDRELKSWRSKGH